MVRLSTFRGSRKARKFVDSVSHNNVMIKLQACGVTDDLNWINAFSVTDTGAHESNTAKIVSGVVQVSVLGHFIPCIQYSEKYIPAGSRRALRRGAPRQLDHLNSQWLRHSMPSCSGWRHLYAVHCSVSGRCGVRLQTRRPLARYLSRAPRDTAPPAQSRINRRTTHEDCVLPPPARRIGRGRGRHFST